MKTRTRFGRTAVTLVMATTLTLPAIAVAQEATATRTGVRALQTAQLTTEQLKARLRERIRIVLQRRKERFDRAAKRIGERIVRVDQLAGKVEAQGGDVTDVRELLDDAREALAEAKELEARAVEQFKAVPGATNKRAAFDRARATGRRAVETLRDSRQKVRAAAVELSRIARELKAES
ncbi:MAG: hypothetical protein C0418_00435 [Coriobacteriaceae bacterium]|nr:hypothetical protein [Coriobacteriaceae bacterium]